MKKNGLGPPKDSKGPRTGQGGGRGNLAGRGTGAGARTGGKKGTCIPPKKSK